METKQADNEQIIELEGQELSQAQYAEASHIAEWLQSETPDYRAGLDLLTPHCRNRTLLGNLAKKESRMNTQKLAYELGKLLANPDRLAVQPSEEPKGGWAILPLVPWMRVGLDLLTPPLIPSAAPGIVPGIVTGQNAPVFELDAARPRLEAGRLPDADALAEVAEVEAATVRQSELYRLRAQLSNTLAAEGETNGPDEVSRRLATVGRIVSLEAEYNALAERKERLLSGLSALGDAIEEAGMPVGEAEPEAPAGSAHERDAQAKLDSLKLMRKAVAPNASKARKAAEAAPDDMRKAEKLARLTAELETLDNQIKLLSEA